MKSINLIFQSQSIENNNQEHFIEYFPLKNHLFVLKVNFILIGQQIILFSLITFLLKKKRPMDIRSLYQARNSRLNGYGIEGYFVEKKYLDLDQLKQQKLYASKQKSPSSKPVNVTQKKTFIDEVQKHSSKLPAPTSYQINDLQSRSRTQSLILPGNRKTIFDQIQHITKRSNFPSPVKYSKIETQIDKSKLRGNLSKADNANYIDSSMRDALSGPGVGSYNANQGGIGTQKKVQKWIEGKSKRKTQNKTKLPPVGTYDPKPIDYSLFSSVETMDKRKSKSFFPKSQRFKSPKQRQIPFYNVLSQWGLKDKRNNKDILSKITRTAGHNSVYY